MIRFRNPGTQYATQIQIIRILYAALHNQISFTLDDMAVVIAESKMMTAYGYSGDDALKLSNTEQESMNSSLMNAKMYAEVFRMLGWVTPYSEDSSYPLVFTYIGAHVALSTGECSSLYEQCVLGINNPTQFSDNMCYDEKVRFFKCVLRTFIDLGGIMYKHEFCLGPMSVDDEDETTYQNMLGRIRDIRGDYRRLAAAFQSLSDDLGMKPGSVDNCTRFPIALMKSCGWVEETRNRSLYGKSMMCLQITPHGREVYERIKNMYDLRLDKYLGLDEPTQDAMIRLGTYSMLRRSGYDISEVADIFEQDRQQCAPIIGECELLFSPCQTLRRTKVEQALGIEMSGDAEVQRDVTTFTSLVDEREAQGNMEHWNLNLPDEAATELLIHSEDRAFLDQVEELCRSGMDSNAIVEELFHRYITATQTVFYPLIATLFKVMGFDCLASRPGDNGARWDAIIVDNERSIPIEIKSPTEEQHLSVKAIRQALENKIILLSRRTHPTTPETTSLSVGYYMPNDRAEVSQLISSIKTTYGFKIGVMDLKSLLSLAVSILVDETGFDREKLYGLEGLMHADI